MKTLNSISQRLHKQERNCQLMFVTYKATNSITQIGSGVLLLSWFSLSFRINDGDERYTASFLPTGI